MIDRSGAVWRGENFEDLRQYVQAYTEAQVGAAAERVLQSRCAGCSGVQFGLRIDDEQGCAERRCLSCERRALIADSDEYWADADPGEAACPCGGEAFVIGVGFNVRNDGNISWVTVGGRCLSCGLLGVYADWKIDYSPTQHLLSMT